MMRSDLMDWVTHTTREEKKEEKAIWVYAIVMILNLVDRHAHMNQSFYFQHVSLSRNDSRALLDASLDGRHMMDRAIGFRVLQVAQVFFWLLILQEVHSVIKKEKGLKGVSRFVATRQQNMSFSFKWTSQLNLLTSNENYSIIIFNHRALFARN